MRYDPTHGKPIKISDGSDHELLNRKLTVISELPVSHRTTVLSAPLEPKIPNFQMSVVAILGRIVGKNRSTRAVLEYALDRIIERQNANMSGGTIAEIGRAHV